MKHRLLLLMITAVLAAGRVRGAGTGLYEDMKVAPHTVYKSILVYAESGDIGSFEKSLDYLAPVTGFIKKNINIDIDTMLREDILDKDFGRIRAGIARLIFLEMRELLYAAVNIDLYKDTKIKKTIVKLAYGNYILISDFLKNEPESFSFDQKIKKEFRNLYTKLSKETPYTDHNDIYIENNMIKDYTGRINALIEGRLDNSLPYTGKVGVGADE